MPYYEYRCNDCGRSVRKFLTYAEFDTIRPECNHCGSDNLQRLISRVALAKSEESRLESMDPDNLMSGLDEEDPRSLGRFMRKMGSEMGEDLGGEFDEVVGRLESGESPESIETSMPDLAASGDGDLPGGDLELG